MKKREAGILKVDRPVRADQLLQFPVKIDPRDLQDDFIKKEEIGRIFFRFWLGKRMLFAAAEKIKKVQSGEAMNPLNTKRLYNPQMQSVN